jgi:hypothetical protein
MIGTDYRRRGATGLDGAIALADRWAAQKQT